MQNISWTDHVRRYYVVREEKNILHTVKGGTASMTGHILRRNYLLKHVTEG